MPRTPSALALPFSGNTVTSRHCSYEGAVTAGQTRAVKTSRYLEWLLRVGYATDRQAADAFGWEISSICSIRNGLFERGKIAVYGSQRGRYGATVTLWCASPEARREAAATRQAGQGAA